MIAFSFRLGRGDAWDAIHVRLQQLAARQDLPNIDYSACVRRAVASSPTLGVVALPALLRLRPDMRLTETSGLLDASLDWVQSVRQAAELVETGRLVWDDNSRSLRAGS
jgi:hypothetical protein